MTEISVVIPVLDEEENITRLYSSLKEVMAEVGRRYEIIFVDDGSTDRSFAILKNIADVDTRVKVIKFRKNFGQTAAIMAGFDHARGDVIVTMDADLQNDPADIPRLLDKMREGYDVVSGWRADRKDPLFTKKIPSLLSNFLARKLTGVNVHDLGCTLKAYSRESVENIELYGEMHRYVPVLVSWRGFRVGDMKVQHHSRKYGKTKYNLFRLLKGFLDLINIQFWTRYSTRPLHFFGAIGMVMTLLGFIIEVYLAGLWLFLNESIADRPLLLLGILFMIVGVQFITFGFLSEILIKIYYSSRNIYDIEKILK